MSIFWRVPNGGAKISIFMEIFFLSALSNNEVLGKNASIQSKLSNSACWSREKREEDSETVKNANFSIGRSRPPPHSSLLTVRRKIAIYLKWCQKLRALPKGPRSQQVSLRNQLLHYIKGPEIKKDTERHEMS